MSQTRETAAALVDAIKHAVDRSDNLTAERAKGYAEALTLVAPFLKDEDSK